ncbi:MAG: copper resistance protein CopC [Actinomycetota bacterium]|nr:copper resistance protein CopC [Actinomycetota bacterium]
MYLGNDRRNRTVALLLAAILLASVILALLATVATAAPPRTSMAPALGMHAKLVSVSPPDGVQLAQLPSQVVLTFDEPMPPDFAQVVLTRDGTGVAVAAPQASGSALTAAVTGASGAGGYRIAWRATSDDGHPVSGQSSFTVTGAASSTTAGTVPPAPGAAAAPWAPSYKTPQTQATSLDHPDHLPGLVVAVVLLLAGVALLLHEQRRRRLKQDEPIS